MAYFPNGSDPRGEWLEDQCSKCPFGYDDYGEPKIENMNCPIASIQFIHNYDQIGDTKAHKDFRNAMNLLVNDKTGDCRVFQMIGELPKETKDQYKLF